METIDTAYLNDLVERAQQGSSNAYAELYAATYQRQYAYAYHMLGDEFLARDALQETFLRALKELHRLQNAALFLAWLSRINFQVCREILRDPAQQDEKEPVEEVEIERRTYSLQQIESLPVTESQVILMHYLQRLEPDEIANQLNMGRGAMKRYLKSGRRHLLKLDF